MNKKYNILCLLLLLALPALCFSAATITGYNPTTGEITCLDAGENTAVGTAALQSTISNIESGSVGGAFTMSGWGIYSDTESDENAVPRYSTTQAYSGLQSVVLDYSKAGILDRYKGNFYRDHGTSIGRVYVSFWVWAQGDDDYESGNQWKIWRIKNDTSFVDGSVDFLQTCFPVPSQRIAPLYVTPMTTRYDCQGCLYDTSEQYLDVEEVPGPGAVEERWVRMEYWIDAGSNDSHDGTIIYKFHDPRNPTTPVIRNVPKLSFDGNLQILKTGKAAQWQAMIFGGAAVDDLDMIVYWDDVFTQVGTWSRVEIGNASTWSACTHRQVTTPTAWHANGQSITIEEPDLGAFDSEDTLYLFVVPNTSTPETDASAGFLLDSTNPVVTCQSADSTTETSYAITATYTLEGARTVASCTWSNNQGGSGTLTATGGNISGTITGLSVGVNTITITLTDSEAEEGECGVPITITLPTPPSSSGTIGGATVNANFR